jgi:hypothetical protein
MRHNIISYSFVFVWKKPILKIPIPDNKFCKDLFDDPYNTQVGFTPEGFIISLTSPKIPNPHILISPVKIDFLSDNFEQLKEIIPKISGSLKKIGVGSLEISAVGVNTEHEFLDIGVQTSKLLAEKFLLPGLATQSKNRNLIFNLTDLRFQIKETENDNYNILVQPRANQLTSLYLNINAHKQLSFSEIPLDINSLYEQTNHKLNEVIFPLLSLEG